MDRRHVGLGEREVLRLSPDDALAQEKAKEADRAAYRRTYWQKYARRVKRIFGVLTPEEHADAKARAEEHGRSIWAQIWAESLAYRQGQSLPTPEVEAHQRRLISELRRIGNNLNQLARLGHLKARRGGGIEPRSDDPVGAEILREMEALEAAVTRFSAIPFKRRSGDPDDR